VETEEMPLTKTAEKLKVNCGTVLRTRMNIDEYALKKSAALSIFRLVRRAGREPIFES
jgi:hypothetical protein